MHHKIECFYSLRVLRPLGQKSYVRSRKQNQTNSLALSGSCRIKPHIRTLNNKQTLLRGYGYQYFHFLCIVMVIKPFSQGKYEAIKLNALFEEQLLQIISNWVVQNCHE